MPNAAKPVRDKVTGKSYPSEVAVGRDLGLSLAPDAPQNNWVWYAIHKAHPERFQTMIDGEWRDHFPDGYRSPAGTNVASQELRKFAVSYRPNERTVSTHYLIEATDRDEAEQILDEELGPARLRFDEQIDWST